MTELGSLRGVALDSKYRLDELLGQGGMGAVFKATHLGTGRVVAVKLILPGLTDQEDFVGRFQREARAAGGLRHPNIVDLTDFGFADVDGRRLAYLVMEFLSGCTLRDVLKEEKQIPIEWTVTTLAQVCSALQEAHDAGIIHRDLKPENVWLQPDRRGGFIVKILDFGLAKLYDPATRGTADAPAEAPAAYAQTRVVAPTATPLEAMRTEVGAVLGTPAYMSPEQCRGTAIDPRSDVYSVGVIAYELLSGRTPFTGQTTLELINAHIQKQPPHLCEVRPDVPDGAADLVMECLQKDPAMRPSSAEVFAGALEAHALTFGGAVKKACAFLVDHARAAFAEVTRAFAVPVCLLGLLVGLSIAYPRIAHAPSWYPAAAAILGAGVALTFVRGWSGLHGALAPRVLCWELTPLRRLPPAALQSPEFAGVRTMCSANVRTLGVVMAIEAAGYALMLAWGELSTGRFASLRVGGLVFLFVAGMLLPALWLLVWMHRRGGLEGAHLLGSLLWVEGGDLPSAIRRTRHLQEEARKRGGVPRSPAMAAALAAALFVPALAGAVAAVVLSAGGERPMMVTLVLLPAAALLGLCLGALVVGPFISVWHALHYLNCRRWAREPLSRDLARLVGRLAPESRWMERLRG